ncbi:MAG TPA: hydroxymethylbilane synthase, partial [Candidatus Thermoplasmatota archaeon]|nr:hydroxymethylbilane synthase [Candidatus Thermoplasmatota archaeon]
MIRIGTRRSPLAQAQTQAVLRQLPPGSATSIVLENDGDLDRVSPLHQLDRPGAFTHALTDAISDGRLDAAVHSLKDLPLEAPPEAPVVAILPRGDPADVLVAREDACDPARPLGLARGSRVGTSAPRRQAQLQDADPGLVAVDVRGNVGTRLQLVGRGAIEALAVAACALDRLETALPPNLRRIELPLERFPTCPGQGAIAVQAAAGSDAAALVGTLDDAQTRAAVEAERSLLRAFGGGCGLPLGAHARKREGPEGWELHATWLSPDGAMARTTARGGSPPE